MKSGLFAPIVRIPRRAHPIGGALGERRGQFLSSSRNRVRIQPGHSRNQWVTPVPEAGGLHGGRPPPLRFIQA